MVSKFERRQDGGTDKPPCKLTRRGAVVRADKTNPENYCTFEEAVAALEAGLVDGIGYLFNADDPYLVLDLDDALDEHGQRSAFAEEVVAAFPTYWEVSTGGRGLHGICQAKKPGPKCGSKSLGIEMYDGTPGSRFVVLTGDLMDSFALDVNECQDAAEVLYRRCFGDEKKRKRAEGQKPRTRAAGNLADDELLDRARNARNGGAFRRLFDDGEIPDGISWSQADYRLINRLIFWCAGDLGRVEALFRRSALHRNRPAGSKHGGYVRLSVTSCFESYTGRYYEPRAVRQESTPKREDILAPYLRLILSPTQWTGSKGATAYKVYVALVLLVVERGINASDKELRVGSDVRTLAERAGVARETLCRSTLPYLVKDLKLIRWRKGKGRGGQSGTFIVPPPKVTPGVTNKDTYSACGLFIGDTWSESTGEVLGTLAEVVRMRSGRAKFATVARLGAVSMFCMVPLFLASGRGAPLDLAELVEATGRRKDNVRRAARKMVAARIIEEPFNDHYRLAPNFWSQYQRELRESGILDAEERQRVRHEEDRQARNLDLAEWKQARHNVVRLPKNRKKPTYGSKKESPAEGADVLPLAKRCDPEEEYKRQRELEREGVEAAVGSREDYRRRRLENQEERDLLADYDRMVEHTMHRLGKRSGSGRL